MVFARRLWMAGLFLVAGCGGGGGGGGGGGSAPLFTGDFNVVSVKADAAPTCASFWGPATSDGFLLSLTSSLNADGLVGGPVPEQFGISVAADGSCLLRDPTTQDLVQAGAVGVDENVVVTASVRGGDSPRIFTLVREASAAVPADVAGAYHISFFTLDGDGRSTATTATFDGAGSGTLDASGIVNANGVVNTLGFSSPVTYTVNPAGGVVLSTAVIAFEGAMDASRELVLLGGASLPGRPPGIFVLVRNAASATLATLAGDYAVVGLEYDFSTPAMRSFGGVVAADGAGTATAQGTANVEGVIAPTLAEGWTYTVAADGSLTVTTPAGQFLGGVCQSGDFALMSGPMTPGSRPATYLLVRR